MKSLKFLPILLIFNISFCQKTNAQFEFRQVTGKVIGYEIPNDGLLVSYVGIKYAVTTDSNGFFCLTVPKSESVFVEISICSGIGIQEITPSDNSVTIVVESRKNAGEKNKENERKWTDLKSTLLPKLKEMYASKEFKKSRKITCR